MRVSKSILFVGPLQIPECCFARKSHLICSTFDARCPMLCPAGENATEEFAKSHSQLRSPRGNRRSAGCDWVHMQAALDTLYGLVHGTRQAAFLSGLACAVFAFS